MLYNQYTNQNFFKNTTYGLLICMAAGLPERHECKLNVSLLTLTLLMWRIWWALNNACRWKMGFNLAFKGVKIRFHRWEANRSNSELFFIGRCRVD